MMIIIRTAVGSMAAVGLIEELKRNGVRVVGTDCDPLSVGFYFCDKSYVVPNGHDPNFVREIIKIAKKEKADAIISGPEEELICLSKNKKEIESAGSLLLIPDYDSVKICADKKKTSQFFEKIGIKVPRIFENADSAIFPCIVKPRFGRGSSGVFKAADKTELEFYLKKVKNPIIQQFIEGEEYTVDIFADFKGEPLSIVPRMRIKIDSGISVKAKTVFNKEIIDYCEKITEKLKLFGPSCIQCIKNKKGIYFLEINARFGGGSILSIKSDPAIISNLIKIAKREKPIKSKGFKDGFQMLRYYSEIYDDKI
ncbi:MAG: carbamoyl-phosphate synthase large subunit [Parcubacteria group bacterium Licking1014_1]|nr:MAG: carbamoyl-phosphate synthase large subunit [Parcubacteria group bacterium Licking1014_1]